MRFGDSDVIVFYYLHRELGFADFETSLEDFLDAYKKEQKNSTGKKRSAGKEAEDVSKSFLCANLEIVVTTSFSPQYLLGSTRRRR